MTVPPGPPALPAGENTFTQTPHRMLAIEPDGCGYLLGPLRLAR